MKVIIVTGTPCTGKTTLAKKLAKRLRARYVDVNRLVAKHKLHEGYDRRRKTRIVDTKKLNRFLVRVIKGSRQDLVIDSHLSQYLPRKYVDVCIVTRCDIKTLEKRLKKRGYSKAKVQENIDAELFAVCYNDAISRGHKVKVVDTTKKYFVSDLLK